MEIKPYERGDDTPTTSLSSKQLPVPTGYRLGGQEQKQMLFESKTPVRNGTLAVPPTIIQPDVHMLKSCLLYILKVYRKSTHNAKHYVAPTHKMELNTVFHILTASPHRTNLDS
jgi:hypothetical protein